ncbi:MAG: hypothetical protein LVT47_15610 [Cyanobacteria bacterium LVE1205-1]|jgi:hypothetical protein
MLAYILALAVGLGSLALYLGAFLVPELHRKNDFIWSGVGLFYALVLWVCAQRITGGVLLGQTASVALLGWFAWQVVLLRRQLLPIERRSLVLNIEGWQDYLEQLSHGKQSQKVIQIIQTFVGSLSRVLSPKEPPLPPVIDGITPPSTEHHDSPIPNEPNQSIKNPIDYPPELQDETIEDAVGELGYPAEPQIQGASDFQSIPDPVPPVPEFVAKLKVLIQDIRNVVLKPKKSRPMIELHHPNHSKVESMEMTEGMEEITPIPLPVGGEEPKENDIESLTPDNSLEPLPNAEDWFRDDDPPSLESRESGEFSPVPLVEATNEPNHQVT